MAHKRAVLKLGSLALTALSAVCLLDPIHTLAQSPEGESAASSGAQAAPSERSIPTSAFAIRVPEVPAANNLHLHDRKGDAGNGLLLTFSMDQKLPDNVTVAAEVQQGSEWFVAGEYVKPADLPTVGSLPAQFGARPAIPGEYVITIEGYNLPQTDGQAELAALAPGQAYSVRLSVRAGDENFYATRSNDAGSLAPVEEWFNPALLNVVAISLIFAVVILSAIYRARKNPNLFIRRINGLEAVDDAIGRATEMGKPILHLNGLDPLTTLSTIAAVNILGRIAKRVADYDSQLMVPCFDPVVMTVSQETVRQAYLEAGRPDAYREDNIFFVTDQQFSYVATVCGIMLREKPAANFFLGYFYAESLLLAETGQSTGAIQIAGTDAQAQLPFFITTCDYTLIGEELYAASAYLSREPMLLGSLKGLDVMKAMLMVMIVVGTLLATFGQDGLARLIRVTQ